MIIFNTGLTRRDRIKLQEIRSEIHGLAGVLSNLNADIRSARDALQEPIGELNRLKQAGASRVQIFQARLNLQRNRGNISILVSQKRET